MRTHAASAGLVRGQSWWVTRNPMARLPIVAQLTLGFVVAALIAAVGSGISGFQRTQTLQAQATVYQTLLGQSVQLHSAAGYLQAVKANLAYLEPGNTFADEDIAIHVQGLKDAATNYESFIKRYIAQDLIVQHPNERTLLDDAGLSAQVTLQQVNATNAERDWALYAGLQNNILANVTTGTKADGTPTITPYPLPDAITGLALNRAAPALEDAITSFATLSTTNDQIASALSLQSAATAQGQRELVTTILAVVLAVIGIALVGGFISHSLVRRLGELHRVSLAVENGQFDVRTQVVGRDEIARVGVSINAMLDTIVGLLDETRRQRDALTSAAERLFGDIRLAGAGDLRVNASVTNDPVGMLGNAFNLTIGRFRRFIHRAQAITEQLEVIARREHMRSQQFVGLLQGTRNPPASAAGSSGRWDVSQPSKSEPLDIASHISRAREVLRYIAQEGAPGHVRALLEYAEEAHVSVTRLNQLISALPQARNSATVAHLAQLQIQELGILEAALRRLGMEAFTVQRTSMSGMNELNAMLASMSTALRNGMLSAPRDMPALPTTDALQAATAFAQEMADLSQELSAIVNEMRHSITPFRLENSEFAGEYTVAAPMQRGGFSTYGRE